AADFGSYEEGPQFEMQMARRPPVGAVEDGTEAVAPADRFAGFDGGREVEVAVHRVEVGGVADDDDEAGGIGTGEDDFAVGDSADGGAGRVAAEGVPIFAGVPPTGVVPRVLAGVAVTDEEAVAGNAVGEPNRQREGGCVRQCRREANTTCESGGDAAA